MDTHEAMGLPQVVELTVAAMTKASALDDDRLCEALIAGGIPDYLAHRAVRFIPMAFAQAALGGPDAVTFADTYRETSDDESDRERALASEPMYVEALAAARLGWSSEVLLAVVNRSAEVAAINQAAEAGHALDSMVLGPTLVPELPPVPEGVAFQSAAMTQLAGPSRLLDNLLAEALAAHDVGGTRLDEGFKTTHGVFVGGVVLSSKTRAGAMIVQLDIRAGGPMLGGHQVIESCAGVGATMEAAVLNGFEKFCHGTLHVLLAAFEDERHGESLVEWTHWTGEHGSWRVCVGPLVRQGTLPDTVDYSDLLAQLEQLWLADPERRRRPHWLRVYCMMGPQQRIGSEVLLDNEAWAEGLEVLKQMPWPAVGTMYSLRNFIVLLPADE